MGLGDNKPRGGAREAEAKASSSPTKGATPLKRPFQKTKPAASAPVLAKSGAAGSPAKAGGKGKKREYIDSESESEPDGPGSPDLGALPASVAKKGEKKGAAGSGNESKKRKAAVVESHIFYTSPTAITIAYDNSDSDSDDFVKKKPREQLASTKGKASKKVSEQPKAAITPASPKDKKKQKVAETTPSPIKSPATIVGTKKGKAEAGGKSKKAGKGEKVPDSKEDEEPARELSTIEKMRLLVKQNQEAKTIEKENEDLKKQAAEQDEIFKAEAEEKKAHERKSIDIDRAANRPSDRKPGAAPGSSRKDKKEATADWLEDYENNGPDGMKLFHQAKDYLMEKLIAMGIDVAEEILKEGFRTYLDPFTALMIEKKLGFKELHESEKQKIESAAMAYRNRQRRKSTK